ncbi:MAG: hypothetical protein GX591_11785 [Planctomycetes bacterium]|nr:hypothetical protein [Planctomycetota bacterium]
MTTIVTDLALADNGENADDTGALLALLCRLEHKANILDAEVSAVMPRWVRRPRGPVEDLKGWFEAYVSFERAAQAMADLRELVLALEGDGLSIDSPRSEQTTPALRIAEIA